MKQNFDVMFLDEAKEFVLNLPDSIKKKVAYNIQRSREVNNPKLLKKIDENIWEFRTRSQNKQIRLLAFWDPTRKAFIVCTHGFIKKSQKTPKSEIEKAEKYRKEYLKSRK